MISGWLGVACALVGYWLTRQCRRDGLYLMLIGQCFLACFGLCINLLAIIPLAIVGAGVELYILGRYYDDFA